MISPQPIKRYLVLRPLVKYVNDEKNNFLYIRVGNRLLKIEGGDGAELTKKILDLARGKRKIGEVIETFPFSSQKEIFHIIDRLVSYGCVEIVEDDFAPALDECFYLEENIVSHLGLSEWSQRKSVAEALSKLVISVISENQSGSDLAAVLRKNKFKIAHTIENGFAEAENMALLKKADLVIGIGSIDNPDFLPPLNQWALKEDKPFLPVGFTTEGRVFVGPLVERKNNGGCYNCLRTRLRMNNPRPKEEAIEVLAKDEEGHGSKSKSWTLLNSFVSGLVMLQLARKLAGFPHTYPSTQVFSLDFSNTTELITSHCLLPMPNCEHCTPWVAGEPVKVGGMEKAVDKCIGIIKKVSPLPMVEQGPKIYHTTSLTSDWSYINNYMGIISNSGAGYNKEESFYAAVGESLERYAASYVDKKRLRLACWKELEGELGHPEQYELFSPEQYGKPGFPYTRFTEHTKVCWIECISLSSGERTWVPASMVYLPYKVDPGEEKITPSISTGLAAGNSFEAAVLTGLYEVVERDAFSLTWLRRIPPVEIKNIEAYFPNFNYFYPTGNFLYKAYEITLDIPLRTVIVIIEELTNKKILSVGGATRRRLEDALKKALLEAAQGILYVDALLDYYKDWKVKSDFTNVSSFQKHALFYSKYPELRQKVGFLLGNDEDIQFRKGICSGLEPKKLDLPEEYRYCIDAVKKAGYDVLAVDLTTPDLKRIGISVVRVIVPGLHGLHGNHSFRFLGGKRLSEVPRKMGLLLEGINEFPHPYP